MRFHKINQKNKEPGAPSIHIPTENNIDLFLTLSIEFNHRL
jgi:hypothetical protein